MALIRARALGALAFGGVDGAGGRVPGPGLGGGGGAGRAAADALPVVGGTRADGFIMVGAPASSAGKAAPHERHEPTSVSLWAPHFGQSMWPFVVRAPKEGQGSGRPRGATFLHWKKRRTCANLPLPRGHC